MAHAGRSWDDGRKRTRNWNPENGNLLASVYYLMFCCFGLVISMGGVWGLVFHDAFGVSRKGSAYGIAALAFY